MDKTNATVININSICKCMLIHIYDTNHPCFLFLWVATDLKIAENNLTCRYPRI